MKVIAWNIPTTWGDDEVRHFFGDYGTILRVSMIHTPDGQRRDATAIIEMEENRENGLVERVNGVEVDGQRLAVLVER